ncbi:protein 4.1b isoform X1 [Hemibagrus wyckioides]|uniref:protein 4.1b isoform X1 n=1 Tax=Hemibagrus wyckioides TaxID=337641 RepID=UPI00266C7AEC|nr:protein 4.1b isoform X1 [Hemibagrus wyckioides]
MATFPCRVILLDGSIIERDLEKKAVGQVLFDKVCEYLVLIERDYFGLAAWDSSNNKVWLELSKKVYKQIISHDATFTFSVKFYPPDPSQLAEDITRYLLCLQLRTDILTSRLPCPSDMLAVLGSYTIQSELGDYNPELHGKEIFSNIPLAPNQTPELEEEVAELHRKLKSMSPAEADQLFLQNVKTLHMYGVHLYPAKDASGGDMMLGVCADGLVVYEYEENTQVLCFSWPTVLKMSYNRSNFQARIFHSEDAFENTIKFSLPSFRACKSLWKNAVEHHAFFRNLKDPDKAPKRLLHVGSRFRFDGLTHAESLEASSNIKRAAPRFARSAIKRKAKESRLVALKRPNRTEFVDWFELLGSDATWPTYSSDKYQVAAGETLVYKEREEVDGLDNEWFQLLGGRSLPTQHSFSSLSSDTDILESAKFQLWKLQADDWFVLLEPPTYHPNFWHWKTRQLSLQSSQAEEQTEELESFEKYSEKGIEIVRIREKEVEAVTEQHEELEMERNLISPDTVGEYLEFEAGDSEQILKVMREKIEEVDGEELQTVVMYEQRRQVVESYTEQEAFAEQSIRGMEVVDAVHELMIKRGEVVSEENIEELEEQFLEVERIEQTQQGIESLKLKLQEVEMLERQLQQMQQAGRQRGENDDWYILLEHKLITSTAPVRLLGVKTSEQKLLQNLERGDRGDRYLLLDRKPLVATSANAGPTIGTAEQKAEIRQWIEGKLERAHTLTPVLMKDDWYILLDLPPRPTQTREPALPPSEIDVQSSWVNVIEEHKNLDEETKWTEERAIHVRETQLTLPVQREEQPEKQLDDDWFIQLDVPPKEAVHTIAVDVHKETREEEEELVHKEVKTITFEEDRREMLETSHEVIEMKPIPFEKRDVPSGPTMDTAEQKAEIRQWIEEKLQRAHTLTPVQMKDDWYILLELPPQPTQTREPALLPSEIDVQSSWVNVVEEHKILDEETKWREERAKALPIHRQEQPKKELDDDWFIQLDVPHKKAEIDVQSSWVNVVEEHKMLDDETKWREEKAKTLPIHRQEQPEKQLDDDWFIQLNVPHKEAVHTIAVDVHKNTREEEEELVQKQVKTITFEEERREMLETSHEAIEMKPIPFKKREVSSAEIRQWIEEKLQRANTLTPVLMKDDWYILLDLPPRPTQTREPALPPSGTTKTKQNVPGLRSQQTVTIKEKEVTFDKKPVIIKEKQEIEKKIPGRVYKDEDDWFVLFSPEQIKKKVIATAGVSDTWILEEKRLREVQKGRLREDMKRSHVVEDRRLHPYVPGPKADERHREVIDDWFILLESVSKISVSKNKRAEEDQRRKEELFKKQALAEDRRKVAGIKHPSVPVIPLTPADQPMTSTPTAQSVRITRPSYQEESLKRLDLTQEITQDIKQESKVESETIIKRKRIEKRIEGESIYIRHSILMLEDSDVTQEIVLKHHASVSELKRIFMEDMPVYGPTEWDRRLSSYTPAIYPKLSSGELLNGIDIMGADGLSAM